VPKALTVNNNNNNPLAVDQSGFTIPSENIPTDNERNLLHAAVTSRKP